MVLNIIYSALVLFVAFVVVAAVLLFGVKFCRNCGELEADPSWKEILLQLLKGYPFWLWIIAFLASQPAIHHILSTWTPSIWSTCGWIPNLSSFIGFITIVFYVILINITDDDGRLKNFRKSK